MAAECPAMAKVFVTRALPFPALDRLREAHEVEEWPGELPPGGSRRAPRRGGGSALPGHRPRRRLGHRGRAAAEGDRQHGGGDRQHRPRGGRGARHPGRQHARRADRRHRRPRLRAAARAGAPDRPGRRDGALGGVADVGAGRRPRRRPVRGHARHRRLGPDRAGGGASRGGLRDGDRPQLAVLGRAARGAAGAGRLRLRAHAAHARDAAPDRLGRARPDEADGAAGQHRARRRGRPGRAAHRPARGNDRRRRARRHRPRAAARRPPAARRAQPARGAARGVGDRAHACEDGGDGGRQPAGGARRPPDAATRSR